jgi:hypothetical protein
MTNGEKFVKTFPDIADIVLYRNKHEGIRIEFESIWWDAEYKEPTTKTCKSCRNYGSHNGVCDICKDYNCFTEQKSNKSEIPTSSDLSSETRRNSEKLEKETANNILKVDCINRDSAIKALDYDIKSFEFKAGVSKYMDDIAKLLDTIYEIQVNNIKAISSVTPQEPILEKINKMKSEIADSLEFWDYSANNNPLARDILETVTNFWGDIREVEE